MTAILGLSAHIAFNTFKELELIPSKRLGSAYFSCVQTYKFVHVNITTVQSYVHLNFTIYLKILFHWQASFVKS